MKKPKPKRLTSAELEALIRRTEARSLQPGDEKIIKAVVEKMFTLSQLVRDNRIPSKRWLRRFLAIRPPERLDE